MKERKRKYVIEGRGDAEANRVNYMVKHMARNRAYTSALVEDMSGALLTRFQDRYRWYRENWRNQPREAIAKRITGDTFRATGATPLCIDIEVAAICDLACPFCFRQTFATPDKVIKDDLCYRIIDQAVEMGVPSLKFNWRGEPLLNPRLPDFIAYAKDKGVLETIINTNATKLDELMSRRLIEAGLDLMIYSFDGGTKETYERMRPGRFGENSFDVVYAQIRRFAEIRQAMGAVLPYTKIQMILTDDSFAEQEAFYDLFDDCVDDVNVKQYTERGAGLKDVDAQTQIELRSGLESLGLPEDTPYMRSMTGELFVATGRLPCEQPFQRLLVTYDGRVAMCCYDWGAQHPIGYVDEATIENGETVYSDIVSNARAGAKGFELLDRVTAPHLYNNPSKKVEPLPSLWYGSEVDRVRTCHVNGEGDRVTICKQCQFKETYDWQLIEKKNS